jgi:hypothetical protein
MHKHWHVPLSRACAAAYPRRPLMVRSRPQKRSRIHRRRKARPIRHRGALRLSRLRHQGNARMSEPMGIRSKRVPDWQWPFDDAVPLPPVRQLVTLRDAADFISELPKTEHDAPERQAAMEALLLVAELGGPTMFARIGTVRALNRHVERVLNPDRKTRVGEGGSWRGIVCNPSIPAKYQSMAIITSGAGSTLPVRGTRMSGQISFRHLRRSMSFDTSGVRAFASSTVRRSCAIRAKRLEAGASLRRFLSYEDSALTRAASWSGVVARSERFELPTLGFEVRCSIQLSYERVRG